MTEYKQIVQLRNKGKTQREIALALGISRRSVIRYLKEGKIPQYKREAPTKKDPMKGFYNLVEEKLKENPRLTLSDLFEFLVLKGYLGSERTLRRKTISLREKYKKKEVFFEREYLPGEVAEGDFTQIWVNIGGTNRKVFLWVTSLPYSNTLFATPFYHQTFECFSEGTVLAFNEFGGVPRKYRLDNMSPAVSKILSGKERLVTKRFSMLQNHYGFFQDFCNPAKGNEKGNVESNNRHLKRKILSRISLNKITFNSLEAFKVFTWEICRELNEREKVKDRLADEELTPLPDSDFQSYLEEIVRVNKYSLFSIRKSGHMYSVPSQFIGMHLEARIYPSKIEVIYNGEIIANHQKIYGPKGKVSIDVQHVIGGLCKKPGAMRDWKYKQVLFERPIWKKFYEKLISKRSLEEANKSFLQCLNLMNKYNKENLTAAMEIIMEENLEANRKSLVQLLEEKEWDIQALRPIKVDLHKYDNLLRSKKNGIK